MLVKYTVSEFLSAKGSFSSIDWQTVQTRIKYRVLQHLARVSTVCLQKVLLNLNKIEKKHPTTLKNGNGLVQL